MKFKSITIYAVLITSIIGLILFNVSKSNTIDTLSQEKASLEQKVASFSSELAQIKGDLDKANLTLKKQAEDLKTMKSIIAHNEQLRDENDMLKQKLAALQKAKAPVAAKAKAKK